MARKIQSTSDLPKWFDLTLYSWTGQIEPRDLHMEFVRRAQGLQEEINGFFFSETWPLIEKNRGRIFDPQDTSPMRSDIEAGLNQFRAMMGEVRPYMLNRTSAVHPLSEGDIKHLYDLITEFPTSSEFQDPSPDLHPGEYISVDAYLAGKDIPPRPYRSYLSKHDHCVRISVDLSMSDSAIIESVRDLLPIWREHLNDLKVKHAATPNASISDFEKINHYRTIPLLDLLLWGKRNDLSIPNRVLTAAIYPDGSRSEDDVRKTIIPFIHRMADPKEVMNLRSALQIKELRQ